MEKTAILIVNGFDRRGKWGKFNTDEARSFPWIDICLRQIERHSKLSNFFNLGLSFKMGKAQDVSQNITLELLKRQAKITGLRRSNANNVHFLLGGVYGNLVYHHGAGSRKARFHTSTDTTEDERIRVKLRNAVFQNLDAVVEELTACKYETLKGKTEKYLVIL